MYPILSPNLDSSGSGTVACADARRRGLPYESSNDGGSLWIVGGGLEMYSVLRLTNIVTQHTKKRKGNSLKEHHETFILYARIFLV